MGKPLTKTALLGVAASAETTPFELAWCCTNRCRIRVPHRIARMIYRLGERCRGLVRGRIAQDAWVRYGMWLHDELVRSVSRRLADKNPRIEPMSEAAVAEFAALHPDARQVVTAKALWAHGLRRAYLARGADNRPLAFIWALSSEDNERLGSLPQWAGIYPPIPSGWIQLENAFSAGRSLGRGRLMTDLACSACTRTNADAAGILAHVGEANRAMRRWIESLGCRMYGKIVRIRLEFPLLRRYPLYVHTVEPAAVPYAALPPTAPARSRAAGRSAS
jgi:hypothetical protein